MVIIMNPNYLKDARCYLIGPITFAKDDGIGWRQNIQQMCKSNGIEINFLDPTNKPNGMGQEVGIEKSTAKEWKRTKQYDKLREYVKKYRRIDLRMVDISDFVIAYIDTNIFMFGSVDEIVTAERQKKPILCILPQGIENAPDWLFAITEIKYMFESIEDLFQFLCRINSGDIDLHEDDKWVLF